MSSVMATVRFRSRIELNNINPFVLVSAARAARLKAGWRKPLPVRVRVNGKPEVPWRTNLMPVGDGGFYLYLHGMARKASATKVGDIALLELEFDEAYKGGPAHPMPSWFREALDANLGAKLAWDVFVPSLRKEVLRYFAHLKSAEAKARNLRLIMHMLSGGRGRFLGRSWEGGRPDT
jgi:hypothetical protein